MFSEVAEEKRRPIWIDFRSGITFNSVLSVFYALLILTPASLYMQLMTGAARVSAGLFVMLLWVEFAKLSGKRLSKQEAYIITLFAVTAAVPLNMVYNVWYQSSDIAAMFGIGPHIPYWVVPPMDANILNLRTFFHSAWILPITVVLLSSIFGLLTNLGLSLFAREMFIEQERLPFPMQHVRSQALITLTEGKRRSRQIFAVAAMIGFGWSFILYTLPILWQAWTGDYVTIIPIPWVDLTLSVERMFPGALFGIATDIMGIVAGLVVPFSIILGTFIASMAKNFLGNWLTVVCEITPDTDPTVPGIQGWWVPGMEISMGMARSTMYFWASINIGLSFALAFSPFIGHPFRFANIMKRIVGHESTIRSREERIIEPFSFYRIMIPMVLGIGGAAVLFYALVPEFVAQFPWIMIFVILSPAISTLITGFVLGVAGRSVTAPIGPLQNLIYYSARPQYKEIDVWFAPNPMGLQATWIDEFKVCQLTETKASSFIKLKFLLWPISILIGYLYMQLFWRIAPIPSARYPATTAYWPIQAIDRSVWIRGAQLGLFRVPWVVVSFVVGTGIYLTLDLLHSPIPYIAIAAGLVTWTPIAFTMLIGGILAIFIRRRAGDAWWHENRRIIAAGVAVGEGVAVGAGVSIALIINSIWNLPY